MRCWDRLSPKKAGRVVRWVDGITISLLHIVGEKFYRFISSSSSFIAPDLWKGVFCIVLGLVTTMGSEAALPSLLTVFVL